MSVCLPCSPGRCARDLLRGIKLSSLNREIKGGGGSELHLNAQPAASWLIFISAHNLCILTRQLQSDAALLTISTCGCLERKKVSCKTRYLCSYLQRSVPCVNTLGFDLQEITTGSSGTECCCEWEKNRALYSKVTLSPSLLLRSLERLEPDLFSGGQGDGSQKKDLRLNSGTMFTDIPQPCVGQLVATRCW